MGDAVYRKSPGGQASDYEFKIGHTVGIDYADPIDSLANFLDAQTFAGEAFGRDEMIEHVARNFNFSAIPAYPVEVVLVHSDRVPKHETAANLSIDFTGPVPSCRQSKGGLIKYS